MKLAATGLLLLMAAIYVVSRLFEGRYPVLGAVSAFSEAGCVGALADWFAVVALFKHPLNLPIPRTAIIPHNRDRIGDALARFVLENFLSRAVLEGRLSSADLAGLAGAWMSDEKNAVDMAERIGEYLPLLVGRLVGEEEGMEGAAGSPGPGADARKSPRASHSWYQRDSAGLASKRVGSCPPVAAKGGRVYRSLLLLALHPADLFSHQRFRHLRDDLPRDGLEALEHLPHDRVGEITKRLPRHLFERVVDSLPHDR